MWVWPGRSLEPHQTLTVCITSVEGFGGGGGAIMNNAERLMKDRILEKPLVKEI